MISKKTEDLTKEDIVSILTFFYEVDLNNCLMEHGDWIEELASALTDPEYLKKLHNYNFEELQTIYNLTL